VVTRTRTTTILFGRVLQKFQLIYKFFDEQDPALDRMARIFASRLVADALENLLNASGLAGAVAETFSEREPVPGIPSVGR